MFGSSSLNCFRCISISSQACWIPILMTRMSFWKVCYFQNYCLREVLILGRWPALFCVRDRLFTCGRVQHQITWDSSSMCHRTPSHCRVRNSCRCSHFPNPHPVIVAFLPIKLGRWPMVTLKIVQVVVILLVLVVESKAKKKRGIKYIFFISDEAERPSWLSYHVYSCSLDCKKCKSWRCLTIYNFISSALFFLERILPWFVFTALPWCISLSLHGNV